MWLKNCEHTQSGMHAWATATNSSEPGTGVCVCGGCDGWVWGPGKGCACNPDPDQHSLAKATSPLEQVAASPRGDKPAGRTTGGARALEGAEPAAPRAAGIGGRTRASGPPRGTWHARADGPRGPEAQRRGSVKEGDVERISALADK